MKMGYYVRDLPSGYNVEVHTQSLLLTETCKYAQERFVSGVLYLL